MRYLLGSSIALLIILSPLLSTAQQNNNPAFKDSQRIKCNPSMLSREQLLEIEMGLSHAGELAVIRPDGEYFFIVYKKPDKRSPLHTLMPSEIFRNIVSIRISPKTFRAHRWREGVTEYELVFDQEGTYKFLLGEQLESDFGNNVRTCKVEFKN